MLRLPTITRLGAKHGASDASGLIARLFGVGLLPEGCATRVAVKRGREFLPSLFPG